MNIWKGLRETNVKDAVITQNILDALEAFESEYPEHADFATRVSGELESGDKTVSKSELRKIFNMRTKAGARFNRYLHLKYGIWVCPEIKCLEFEPDFLLENVLDIKYFIDENTDGKGIRSFNYYVGMTRKALQSSIHNASIVRQVIAEKELEFEELLPLMAVDFVRIGEYTVLPFPFKYIREYKEI